MKLITKLTLALTALAAFAVTSALADDPSPRWQAETQRQQKAEHTARTTTTVAVYSRGGLGQRAVQAQPSETHLEFRDNAHGQSTAVYVPGSK